MIPGDIIAVRGSSWLSRQIIKATGGPPSHVGLCIAVAPFPIVIEALSRVRTRPLAVSLADAEHAWGLSDRTLDDASRARVVAAALQFSADSYGYLDIALQGLNALAHTTWWTDHLGMLDGKPICSYLVAAAYYEAVSRGFGQQDRTTTPSDIFAWAVAHPGKYVVTPLR